MHELLLAARAGDIEKVKACLARGDNIEMQEDDSGTPLFCAAAEGHLEVVKWLLERGARVRTANIYHWNALHVAVQKHHHAIVDELIKYLKYCDICKSLPATPRKRYGPFPGYGDHRDPYHAPRADTAIHIAAKYGNLYGLKKLLKRHPKQINFYGAYGYTSLMYAVAGAHVSMVKWLIEQKANLELANDEGQTIFDIAVQGHSVDIVELLFHTVNNNVLTATNRYGDTVFHSIAWAGNLDLLQKLLHKYPAGYLLEGASGNKVWFTAFDQNHFHIVHYLINTYGNKVLFQPSPKHGLPIQLAVKRYAYEHDDTKKAALQSLIEALLNKNADLAHFIGLGDWQPIQNKLLGCQTEFAKLLLATIHNNLASKAYRANAPYLQVAAENSLINAIPYLMLHMKEIHGMDCELNTPLHYAAHDINLFHYIRLIGNADITIENKQGLTPFDLINIQAKDYAAQEKQYDEAFLAANFVCQLLTKIRLWQLINQADATFKFFALPLDLQRLILLANEDVPLSLLSDEQIQNLIKYGHQRETLNSNYPNTANNRIEFLKHIDTNTRYGFFAAGLFMPPKEKSSTQLNDKHQGNLAKTNYLTLS